MTPEDADRFLREARRQAHAHRGISRDDYEDAVQDAAVALVTSGTRLDGANPGGFVYRAIQNQLRNRRRIAEGRKALGDTGPVGDRELPETLVDPGECAEPWFWENLRGLLPANRAESFRAFFAWVSCHGDTAAAGRIVGVRPDSVLRAVQKLTPFARQALDLGEG